MTSQLPMSKGDLNKIYAFVISLRHLGADCTYFKIYYVPAFLSKCLELAVWEKCNTN